MIEAQGFVERLRRLGYEYYAAVPCSFLTPFIDYVIDDERLSYLAAANEGDALASIAGAHIGGKDGVVMMQNSGLGNAVNPLASLSHPFRIPALLIVTLRGDPQLGDEPQHELMGRVTGDLLEALGVPWELFPSEEKDVERALDRAQAHIARERRPYALVMRKGSVVPYAPTGRRAVAARGRAAVEPRIYPGDGARRWPSRAEALERLVALTTDPETVVVATTGYTGRELYAIADRPNHFYMVGSMGCAAALGLGLSLARPDLRVVVVDGDGAALMRMGNLATAGVYGGSNLVHLVLDNEAHESTGGQPTVSPGVSFAHVAAACGYGRSALGEDLELLEALLADPGGEGPAFGHLRIRPGVMADLPRPGVGPEQVCRRLRAHIGASQERTR